MMNNRIDINQLKDYDMRTPLHIATSYGKDDIALYLINRGHNVNVLDRWKRTPLFYAVDGRHERVVRLIVQH